MLPQRAIVATGIVRGLNEVLANTT